MAEAVQIAVEGQNPESESTSSVPVFYMKVSFDDLNLLGGREKTDFVVFT
jgi:hypothetical protein